MVFTQESETPSGRTYSFWAGGHVVYFMCVLTANLVLLRATHNYTGWGELFILVQLVSFPVIVYLDSILLSHGVIAYFFDEFLASWTAWLGVLLVGAVLFVEGAVIDSYGLFKQLGKGLIGPNRIGVDDYSARSSGVTSGNSVSKVYQLQTNKRSGQFRVTNERLDDKGYVQMEDESLDSQLLQGQSQIKARQRVLEEGPNAIEMTAIQENRKMQGDETNENVNCGPS